MFLFFGVCVRGVCSVFFFNIFIKVLIFLSYLVGSLVRAKCLHSVLVQLKPFFRIDICEFLRWYYIYIVIFLVRRKFNIIACCYYFNKITVWSQHTVHCWIYALSYFWINTDLTTTTTTHRRPRELTLQDTGTNLTKLSLSPSYDF